MLTLKNIKWTKEGIENIFFFFFLGTSKKLVIDNGTLLYSELMEHFLKKNRSVKHIKTLPYNSSMNGVAKNIVKTFKTFWIYIGTFVDLFYLTTV